MRDYSKLLNENISWKSEAEILDFEHKYKKYIHSVLRKNNVDEHSSNILYDDILIKFSQGMLEYNPENGNKYETYLFRITQNMATDFFRERKRHNERYTEVTETNTSTLFDLSHGTGIDFEYFRAIAIETLKRLYKANASKKENLEIFTKRCFADVPLEQLSADYNRKKNEISLIVSRLHKKYKAIFDEVVEEMDSEQMKQSNISIDFLSPIVDFPISA